MSELENILSHEFVQKLGWTLLHFIWQATAVALLAAILLRMMRRFSANLRYVTACLALGSLVLLPVVTMHFVKVESPPVPVEIESITAPVILPAEPAEEMPLTRMTEYQQPVQSKSSRTNYFTLWKQQAVSFLEPTLPHIVTGWLLGVLALSLWHLGGWAQLQKLRKKMVKQVDTSLINKLDTLAKKLGIKKSVELLESALIQIPTVVGWLRPVILLPASALTGLTSSQLEAILAHELAHIKRFDYLVNMLQTIVEILGFYHPAVWWISHKIRVERENCCDDLAVAVTKDRICYAKALTSMEEIRGGKGELAVAAAGGNMFSRIRRLISKDSNEKTFSWIPAVTVIILLVALAIPTTLALATKSDSQQSKSNTDIQIEVDKLEERTKIRNASPIGDYALEFDGIDDYLEIQASKSLQLGRDFTIQMWIKPEFPDTSTPDNDRNLLSKGGYIAEHPDEKGNRKTNVYGFGFKLRPEDGSRIALDMSTANGSLYTSTNVFPYKSGWLHLVISSSESGGASKGINYIHTSEATYHPAPKSNIIVGGKSLIPTGNHFKGQIAELRIWNRVLSLAEIKHFKTVALSGDEPNLVGCWTFEQGQGQRVHDISPYRNDASLGSSYSLEDSDPVWVRIGAETENEKPTNMQVEGEKSNIQIEEKLEISTEKLKQLGLALAIYAADNDSKLPETLDILKPYLADEQTSFWVQNNVVYLGKGIKRDESTSWNIPTAYDKSLLQSHQGTNVLFLGAHVEFVEAEKLKELGITPISSTGDQSDVQIEANKETIGRYIDNSAFFTQPVTCIVNSIIEQKDCFIDFDNNKLSSPPADFYSLNSEQQEVWRQENGIDASASTSEGGEGLWGEQMVVIPVANKEFDRMTPSSFRELLQQATPATPAVMTAIGELPKTYIFKTREGGMGLLQILEVQNEQAPRHIKIHYKMVPRTTEAEARITSDEKLNDLGKAMVMYMNDQQTLPDNLQDFTPYLRNKQDIDWLSQNVEYLGKGKTEKERPDTIIAYDRSLLKSQQGTNVLFLDGHVEFVESKRLKELGISAIPVQIELRLLQTKEEFLEEVGENFGLKLDSHTWLDDLQVASLLRASQKYKDTKALAAPRATIMDNETVQYFIMGQEMPSISGYTEPNSPAEKPKAIIDYIKIGTICELTPHVSPDKQNVLLEFKLDINQLIGFEERIYKGKYIEQVPQIETKTIATSIATPAGKTLLIDGGTITSYEKKKLTITEKVFGGEERTKEEKRLIVLFKPTVLSSEQAETLGLDNVSPQNPQNISDPMMGGYGGYGQGELPGGFGGSGYGTIAPEIFKLRSAQQEQHGTVAKEPSADQLVNRVYDISDIVLVGTTISTGVDGMISGYGERMGGHINIPDQAIVNEAQKIVNLIIQTIEPNSWYEKDPNAKGTIFSYPATRPKKLAITQNPSTHIKIEKLLESQREQIDTNQISIELRYLYTNLEFLDEVKDSMDIEFKFDTFLDDKQVETLLRASLKNKDIRSLMAIVTVPNNGTARFNTARQRLMSFLGYSEPNNLSEPSLPVPINTFCRITPHIEDNKNIIIDFAQDIPGLQERIIYDRREMVQSYTETTTITNKWIPHNKTFAFTCDIIKFDQDNQTASPTEKKTLIVLIKPTIITPEQTGTLGLDSVGPQNFNANTIAGYRPGGSGYGSIPPVDSNDPVV